MSGAAHNGDMSTVTFGFSAQSDESRHMTLGIECIKFMLEQDPDNLPIVQRWIDKWTWRGTRKLSQKAVECPGVTDELNKLKEQGYPMSVVSTSAKSRVVASIEKAGIAHFFPPEHVYSAATSLDPPSSKPDPAIYLYAAEQLGVKPHEAITVEDSKSGATAAMRAGIPCIGYVGIYGIEEGKEKMDQMAKLLTEETKCAAIMYDWKEFQECLKKVEAKL